MVEMNCEGVGYECADDNWISTTLGDIITLNYGKSLPERKRKPGKIPVYGSNGITGYHDKALISGPGIIVGRKGTSGAVHYCKADYFPIDTTFYITPSEDYDLRFIFYKLQTLELDKLNFDSAVPGLNRNVAYSVSIKIPQKEEQKKIASILSALDDKIELNHQMNRTLEEMAQAIFKSWFVDFEPFQNGEFEYNDELQKEIPKGWDVGQISDIAKVTSGKRPSVVYENEFPESPIPVYGGSGVMGYTLEPLFPVPILITGRVGTLGKIYRANPPSWPSDNTLVVIVKNKAHFEFLYFLLKRIKLESLNRGTSNPLITQGDIKRQKVVLPPEDKINSFSLMCHSLFEQCDSNDRESYKLAKIRDVLLPKLLSGEIRVDDLKMEVKE